MSQRESESSPVEPGDRDSRPSSDERTWAMIAHLSAFVGLLAPIIGQIGAPLVIWLTRRDVSAFVAAQAKEALNFNLTVVLAGFVCGGLIFFLIGIPLLALLFLVWVTLTIVAALKASEGVDYRYPLTLRPIR